MADPEQPTYVYAASRPWHRSIYERVASSVPGRWVLAERPGALAPERLAELRPRYVFFPHWSWVVPEAVVRGYECVCFHMTDVPYGRGGSPLQNLVVRGHTRTKLTALRMAPELDAGPVYLKRELCLQGGAEEVYLRAGRLSAEMVRHIAETEPEPTPQEGEPVVFRRRRPEQSALPAEGDLLGVHDFVRMLDAEGYPHAFVDHGPFRIRFTRSALYDGRVVADATVTLRPPEPE